MPDIHTTSRTPILISEVEHERLTELALAALGKSPGALYLIEELSRAKVAATLPAFVVRIGSTVTFTYNGSRYRDYRLVWPDCADFAEHRISVLSPVGAMLLGLAEGQSIAWKADSGVTHSAVVENVQAPAESHPAATTASP